ncbi:Crp/Fnr family transcriptional regulator [Devosia pacifica]|uniref:Crp/Fnr family transcriptional regulator n=1 Tax=Devosia pacifica TaxID=1335967 RepID=A0A918RXM7_9HYPH|nr:Crp/Fnr family transcriptional regulator [Devosia pacifica]GHA15009.1 Crp/Fnr family transcriptional regulator [Devosia pacifica]
MALQKSHIQNRLLRYLEAEDFEAISGYLEPVRLIHKQDILAAGEDADFCYFPDTGIGSLMAVSTEGNRVEVGLIGRDGVLPVAPVLGVRRSSTKIIMQVPGQGHRIPVHTMMMMLDERAGLRKAFLNFAHTLWLQTAHTAQSNAIHKVTERLARWILMCHDRVDDGDIELTHEFIALMLAVRRPSVTESLHILEGAHMIRSRRGVITVLDREALELFAQDAYGTPEREYQELLGPLR